MKQTMVEVPLDNGTTWTGTERELRTKHPDWLPYAKIIQLGATATRQTEEAKQGRKAHPGAIDLLTPRTREHVRGYYDTDEENDEQYYPQRQHTSAVRYTTRPPQEKTQSTGTPRRTNRSTSQANRDAHSYTNAPTNLCRRTSPESQKARISVFPQTETPNVVLRYWHDCDAWIVDRTNVCRFLVHHLARRSPLWQTENCPI